MLRLLDKNEKSFFREHQRFSPRTTCVDALCRVRKWESAAKHTAKWDNGWECIALRIDSTTVGSTPKRAAMIPTMNMSSVWAFNANIQSPSTTAPQRNSSPPRDTRTVHARLTRQHPSHNGSCVGRVTLLTRCDNLSNRALADITVEDNGNWTSADAFDIDVFFIATVMSLHAIFEWREQSRRSPLDLATEESRQRKRITSTQRT